MVVTESIFNGSRTYRILIVMYNVNYKISIVQMLVWVIDILCKSKLLNMRELFNYDNLIKCKAATNKYIIESI